MKKHILLLLALCGVQSHAQPVQPAPVPGTPQKLTAEEKKEIIRKAHKQDAADAELAKLLTEWDADIVELKEKAVQQKAREARKAQQKELRKPLEIINEENEEEDISQQRLLELEKGGVSE